VNLDDAAAKHAEWKVKLRTAISSGDNLDVRSIGADNCCDLGRWLSADAKRLLGSSPALDDCARKHTAFHREAGRVAEAINAKRMDDATAMIGPGTPYTTASTAVAVAIMRLKKEHALS
jgi:methyl-accepting chemotaxis protein